jgi:hypothetical protein
MFLFPPPLEKRSAALVGTKGVIGPYLTLKPHCVRYFISQNIPSVLSRDLALFSRNSALS